VLSVGGGAAGGGGRYHPVAQGTLPDFTPGAGGYKEGLGFSIEVWIEDHQHSKTGDVLIKTTPGGSSEHDTSRSHSYSYS